MSPSQDFWNVFNLYYVNLYVGSRATIKHNAGTMVIRQTTKYPWDGTVKISVEQAPSAKTGLMLRVPAWCRNETMRSMASLSQGVKSLGGIFGLIEHGSQRRSRIGASNADRKGSREPRRPGRYWTSRIECAVQSFIALNLQITETTPGAWFFTMDHSQPSLFLSFLMAWS